MAPAYVGKRRSPRETRWFSGLAAWWNAYTPEYVTQLRAGGVARLPVVASSEQVQSIAPTSEAPSKQAVSDSLSPSKP